MLEHRPNSLTLLLLFASLVSIVALGAVCGVAVVSLNQLSEVSDSAMQRASRRVGRKAGLSADDLKIYVPSSVRSGPSKTRTMGTATGSRRLPM